MTDEGSRETAPAKSPVGVPAASTLPSGSHGASVLVGDSAQQLADELTLTYSTGVEIEARSQWAYIRRRFLRHRLAMVSLLVVLLVFLAGAFASQVAPYSFDQIDLNNSGVGPTFHGTHL